MKKSILIVLLMLSPSLFANKKANPKHQDEESDEGIEKKKHSNKNKNKPKSAIVGNCPCEIIGCC